MGEVHAQITLKNYWDRRQVLDGLMPEEDMRCATVTAVVDTGALYLVMGEELREQLGLKIEKPEPVYLAGGGKTNGYITEPVNICWKNKNTTLEALVLPDQKEVLLGVIPLEAMDLLVDPVRQELINARSDKQMRRASGRVCFHN